MDIKQIEIYTRVLSIYTHGKVRNHEFLVTEKDIYVVVHTVDDIELFVSWADNFSIVPIFVSERYYNTIEEQRSENVTINRLIDAGTVYVVQRLDTDDPSIMKIENGTIIEHRDLSYGYI